MEQQLTLHVHDLKSTRLIDGKQINILPLSRSLQEIKETSKKPKDDYGCCKAPLLDIKLDHIIVDELHLLLRIIDLLTANSTTEIID
ncbi:hypothetical protein pdam_00025059 [Pocillopora damicornis]|uniref:Uncharacterized protein n=1 Tax=Pocillopora damicornis TaxID=46731 RepID=A0A3M6UYZ9_POCDA|nr:hypothetical protein pdam_00025059 [Pocillopora damicornis]